MKYIIMCGGNYSKLMSETKHFLVCNGEPIIYRTIRLLQEFGINKTDIYISSNNPLFDKCGVVRLSNKNNIWQAEGTFHEKIGYWLNAFYPVDEECCYLFGDVFYSPEAIQTIINTDCTDFRMFGNVVEVPGTIKTIKDWDEPLAFKVKNQTIFKQSIIDLKHMWDIHDPRLCRHPNSWELYRYLNGYDLKKPCINDNFTNINDYSTDVDCKADIDKIEYYLKYHKRLDQNKSKQQPKKQDYYLYF